VEIRRLHPGGEPVSVESALADLGFGELAPEGRPYVVVNFVSSLDGRAAIAGKSAPLSSDTDRKLFHLLRAQVDAVFAGTRTLRLEGYGRIVRDAGVRARRADAGFEPDPLALVISRSGDIPWEIPLFGAPEQRIAVYTGEPVEAPATEAQVTVTEVAPETALGEGLALARSEHGVRSVLCEGGPRVFAALLADGLVDEVFLSLAPKLAGGGEETNITTGPGLPEAADLELAGVLEADSALFLRYRVRA
jgi:riboflavin-specific deaminase-like protein